MDGITSGKNKWLMIIFRIITILLFLICIVKRFLINYEHIYSLGLSMENSLICSVLAIVFFIAFCLSFIKIIKKNAVAFIITTIVFVVISSVVLLKVPSVYQYESNQMEDNLSTYFLFDDFVDENSSKNYYYLKKVELFDSYWIGCNLYKEFEAANSFEDLSQEANDKSVRISYYYLKDPSGRRIKEYTEKKSFSEAFDINVVYDNEIHTDEYSAYEYGNQLEFISEDDDMVFYISTNKNKYTNYDFKGFIEYANNLLGEIENVE